MKQSVKWLITSLVVMGLMLMPKTIEAQDSSYVSGPDFQDIIPTEIVAMSSGGKIHKVLSLVKVDSVFLGDFTPGKSDTLPAEQLAVLDSLIANLQTYQYVFYRGTADSTPWVQSRLEVESFSYNQSIANSRAEWAREYTEQGRLLHPVLNYSGRGVIVYITTYKDVELVEEPPTLPVADTTYIVTVVYDSTFVYDSTAVMLFRIGMGIGYAGTFVDGFDFNVPTVQFLLGLNDNTFLTFAAGYRIKNQSDDPNAVQGERTEAYLSVTGESYKDMLGVAVGGMFATENVRSTDEYLERVYGLTVGPRVRFGDNLVVLGLDFGYFNASSFGTDASRWRFGIAPTVRINYLFD